MPGKRKSDVSTVARNSKKAKSTATDHAFAKSILAAVRADSENASLDFDIGDEATVRQVLSDVTNYAHSLEEEVAELKNSEANGGTGKAEKSPEAIAAEAERVRETVVRGITRQLVWKASCKMNTARFVFDGFCPDPLVFGALFGLDGPPKFKQKKMPGKEFESHFGQVIGSARYNELYITASDIIIRYNKESGEFKISGCYGVLS